MNYNDLIMQLRNDFLQEKYKPYVEPEFYKVIVSIRYDDGFYMTRDSVCVKEKVENTRYTTSIFGNRIEEKVISNVIRHVTVYAVKKPTGIYELSTDRELAIYGEKGGIYCLGLNRVQKGDEYIVGNEMMFIDSNYVVRSQYQDELYKCSNEAYNIGKNICENQENELKNKEKALDYLKRYR